MDRNTEARLKKELVAWLGTVGADSRPHATLVWFRWDGESFLVYSVPGQKVRDIEGNPNVELHLNSDPLGESMVRVTGTAKVVNRDKPARADPAYVRKYRLLLKDMGYTWDQFAGEYHIEIHVRPDRIR